MVRAAKALLVLGIKPTIMAVAVSDNRVEKFDKPPPPKKKWIQDYLEKDAKSSNNEEDVKTADEEETKSCSTSVVRVLTSQPPSLGGLCGGLDKVQDYIDESNKRQGRHAGEVSDEESKQMACLLDPGMEGQKFKNSVKELSMKQAVPQDLSKISQRTIGGVVQGVISQFLNGNLADVDLKRRSRKRRHHRQDRDKARSEREKLSALKTAGGVDSIAISEDLQPIAKIKKVVPVEADFARDEEDGALNLSLPKPPAAHVTFASLDQCYGPDSYRSSKQSKSVEMYLRGEDLHNYSKSTIQPPIRNTVLYSPASAVNSATHAPYVTRLHPAQHAQASSYHPLPSEHFRTANGSQSPVMGHASGYPNMYRQGTLQCTYQETTPAVVKQPQHSYIKAKPTVLLMADPLSQGGLQDLAAPSSSSFASRYSPIFGGRPVSPPQHHMRAPSSSPPNSMEASPSSTLRYSPNMTSSPIHTTGGYSPSSTPGYNASGSASFVPAAVQHRSVITHASSVMEGRRCVPSTSPPNLQLYSSREPFSNYSASISPQPPQTRESPPRQMPSPKERAAPMAAAPKAQQQKGKGEGNKEAKKGSTTNRELHNKLEKNRRAVLKQCFDELALSCELDPKKASNLTVIRSAYKYVMTMRRKERENEKILSDLVQEKIKKKQQLEKLKMEMPGVLEQLGA